MVPSRGFYFNPGPSNLSSKTKFAQIWDAGADGLSMTFGHLLKTYPRKKNPVGCRICGQVASELRHLKNHLINVHATDSMEFVNHISTAEYEEKSKKHFYECDLCGKISNKKGNIRLHMETMHEQNSMDNVRLISQEDFEEKSQALKDKKWAKCLVEHCKFVSASTTGISHHLRRYHKISNADTYKYYEAITKEEFEQAEELIGCEFCKKSYTGKYRFQNFEKHKRTVHGDFDPEIAKFECSDCKVLNTTMRP